MTISRLTGRLLFRRWHSAVLNMREEHTDIYSSCRLIVKKNGAEIYNRTALDNTLIYSGVIDMPAGHGH